LSMCGQRFSMRAPVAEFVRKKTGLVYNILARRLNDPFLNLIITLLFMYGLTKHSNISRYSFPEPSRRQQEKLGREVLCRPWSRINYQNIIII